MFDRWNRSARNRVRVDCKSFSTKTAYCDNIILQISLNSWNALKLETCVVLSVYACGQMQVWSHMLGLVASVPNEDFSVRPVRCSFLWYVGTDSCWINLSRPDWVWNWFCLLLVHLSLFIGHFIWNSVLHLLWCCNSIHFAILSWTNNKLPAQFTKMETVKSLIWIV